MFNGPADPEWDADRELIADAMRDPWVRFALKVLPEPLSADQQFRERFIREADLAVLASGPCPKT